MGRWQGGIGDGNIVAGEPDRSDRGTGSGTEDRHANEQGSVRGTHLWYAKLDRGSRSTLVWIDDLADLTDEILARLPETRLETRDETKRRC
jgi:hypothetical protein